jgi:flagellar secretion chaperone FliS
MNPYRSYQNSSVATLTRIDMLLTIYDRTIERLEQAYQALADGKRRPALTLLMRAQGLVMGLAAGVDPNAEIASRMLPLLSIVVTAISLATLEKIEASIRILTTLREGFRNIRSEAVELERNGVIPPIGSTSLVSSMA